MRTLLLLFALVACGGDAQPQARVATAPPPAQVTASAAPIATPSATADATRIDAGDSMAALPRTPNGDHGDTVGSESEFTGGGSGIGNGTGTGSGSGLGRGNAYPLIRQGTARVNGHLPPEVIRRYVRRDFPVYERCYKEGLRQNPHLAGRVAVHFVIDATGAVSNARNDGGDLASPAVVACVVGAFSRILFPAPEHGVVNVVFPLIFSPAE